MSNLATIVNNILADSGIDDINVVVTTGSYSNPAWITALGWSKITGTPTTIAGYGITNAYTKTEVDTLLNAKQNTLTLTTTGTSGAATLVGATLNIPQYQSVLTNPVTGTGTSGQVAYWSSSSAITGESNLFWDAANDRLGVGINAPIYSLDVRNSVNAEPYVQAQFKSDGAANIGGLLVAGTTQAHVRFLVGSSTWGGAGAKQWQVRVGNGSGQDSFSVYSWTVGDNVMSMSGTTGNVGINADPDSSSKLIIRSTNVHPNVLRLENNNTTANEAGIRMRAINPDGTAYAHADIGVYSTGSDTGNFFIKFPYSNNKQENVRLSITQTGAATFSSSVTASSLIKSGGTSSQFLMADGSVNTNVLSSGAYLPLIGGTLTGTLTISGLGYGNSLVISTSSANGADIRLWNTSAGGKIYNITSTGVNNGIGAGGLQFYNETDGVVAFGYTSARNFLINTSSDNGSRLRVNGTGWFDSGVTANGASAINGTLTITGGNGGNDPYAHIRINGQGTYPSNIAGIAFNNSGVQQHIRFLKNGVERLQIRYNEGATEDNKLKFYSFITGSDFATFNANNDNIGFGTTNPLGSINNKGVQIERGGHTTLMLGDGSTTGGVLQSSDNTRRMFMGANIYDDEINSWSQFTGSAGYAAFDAIGGAASGLARILVGSPADSGYATSNIFFEAYKDDSSSYVRIRTNSDNALYISNAGRTILGSESDNGYKLQVTNGSTWSNGVRIGRDFSIANRATVRLDSNGDYPADILFGRDTAATQTSWTGVYWSISSRGSGEGNEFRIYRGVANTGGTEIVVLGFTPSAGAATFINTVTATGFFESSDSRIKTLLEDKLDYQAISNVTAKYYEKNGKIEIGYFAQDFEALLPSAVSKNEDGYLNLSYREVHTAKIAYLEKRITELEKQLKNK